MTHPTKLNHASSCHPSWLGSSLGMIGAIGAFISIGPSAYLVARLSEAGLLAQAKRSSRRGSHCSGCSIAAARAIALTFVFFALALVGGCATQRPASPYAGQSAGARDTARAEALNQETADVIGRDPARAERLLREALAADLYHGAAHNNLGTILLGQGKLYDAAAEFEWARKLLPGHPDPRHNLALTFELAGRYDDALATYAAALDVYPEHLPTIQAMVRL
ncbi:MAG: tetratricopeptide repeat protein, partial [Phycisphaerales bacterium]|nr:tetratricopeptide repeat protein [Phycisphaerales bacterium]